MMIVNMNNFCDKSVWFAASRAIGSMIIAVALVCRTSDIITVTR